MEFSDRVPGAPGVGLNNGFKEIHRGIVLAASPDRPEAARLRQWMESAWHQLAFTPAELHPEPEPSTSSQPRLKIPPPSAGELQAIYADPDGAWQGRLGAQAVPGLSVGQRYTW